MISGSETQAAKLLEAQVQMKLKHPRWVLNSPARAVLSALHARVVSMAPRLGGQLGSFLDLPVVGPEVDVFVFHLSFFFGLLGCR